MNVAETRESLLAGAVELCESQPIRSVAMALHKDYPEHFVSVQAARSAIGYRRGAIGDRNRGKAERSGKMPTEPKLSTIAEGLAKLKSQPQEPDLKIKILGARVGVVSDVHLPYHDKPAVQTALEHLKGLSLDVLLLNGDIIDFYGISRFTREQGRMPVNDELKVLYGFLKLLRAEFPNVRIIYKLGNHEARLRTYLLSQAKEIADLEALKFENLSGCFELGIEVVRQERIMLGGLSVLHGHELPHGIAAPVNPARGVYIRTKASTLVGHHHQASQHSESDLNGRRVSCWSTGCLCRLTPEYNPFAYCKWSHGFAVVEVGAKGEFMVRNHQIIDGRVF